MNNTTTKKYRVTWLIPGRHSEVVEGKDMFDALEKAGITENMYNDIEGLDPLNKISINVINKRMFISGG